MNDVLKKLLDGLQGTSAGTRVVVALLGVSLLAIAALAAVVTNRPHYELAFSGLTDHELAQVCRALAEAAIPFEQSQPPGPFTVYVDEGERSRAYMAVYGAGALDKPLEGILSDGGMSAVFNSAEERAQGVRKREWQEMENMLEELDFVEGARVRTSNTSSSPLLDAGASANTASVTLRIAGGATLSAEQAATVATLVSRGLGVHPDDLVISDQNGRALYDGTEDDREQREVKDLLAHQGEHDSRLAREANAVLEEILGPGKARVTVSSEWDYAQTTLHKETSEKGAVLEETKTSSEKPLNSGNSASIAAGLSSNTLDPENPNAPPAGSSAAAPLVEKTSEEKKQYSPTVSREDRVRFVPELKRLSLALFLDQSVDAGVQAKLADAVKAAVGFDETRSDVFSSVVLPFVSAPVAEAPAEVATPPAEPNPLVETLLRRGIEIASAVVFLVLLAKTLRGSKKKGGEPASAAAGAEAGVDVELLARAQVDELLKSDPAKVGEVLARWAREEPVASKG